MDIDWEPAVTNDNRVVSKKAKCGCEVIFAFPMVINACSPEHYSEIDINITNSLIAKNMKRYGIEL